MKGTIYYVAMAKVIFSHVKITIVIFTCEDIKFSRESSPDISLVFIIINRTLHGRLEIRNFISRVEKIFHLFAVLTHEIFFNTRREILYLRAAM